MALGSWKSFNFFIVTPVKAIDESDNVPPLFEGADITALTSGSDTLFIGTSVGIVHVVNSAFKIVRSFPTYENDSEHVGSIRHIKQVEGTKLLVTVSEDLSTEPVLKVWALDKTERKTGLPRCQSTVTIQNGRRQFPISAFATTPSLSLVAVGFANGSIVLIRGDLIHDRGSKQRIIFESEEPITNLCFSPPPTTPNAHAHHGGFGPYRHTPAPDGGDTLYVSTIGRILTLITAGKGTGQPRVLEPQGCGPGCMKPAVDFSSEEKGLAGEGSDIVVARDDAIYFYGPNGRGACYAYEGPKEMVHIFKNYVALVSPPASQPSTAPKSGGMTGTLKRLVGRGVATTVTEDPFDVTKFTLLDTELKFVAHSERLISGVKQVFSTWGDLFVLTFDGKVHRYHEVSLQEKLGILYARNLYIPAINLAQKAGVGEAKLRAIYRRYADYLYGKGDWDGSMQWYIKAIGKSNEEGVSTVIRKFLDTQRIHNLIEYLEELHMHDIATSDHTTLLLNCYAKLKDIEKLEKFIKVSSGEGLKFDVDTAIAMCRQAGYYEQAVYLAERQGEHEAVVGILVENLGKVDEALGYTKRLEPEIAYSSLMRYARTFLQEVPQQTTDFFIEYYTGRYIARKKEEPGAQMQHQEGRIQSYLNASLLQQLPYMGGGGQLEISDSAGGEGGTVPLDLPAPYKPPKPRTAFSSFVDHAKEFVEFLENVLETAREGVLSEGDRVDIYTTLFEMYLQRANEAKTKEEKQQWETKAKGIIEDKETSIDTSNVLLLSHLSNFRDGTVLVREQQGLRFDIFRSCCSAGDTAGAVRALKKYGAEEPQLYVAALSYFTSSPKVLADVGEAELQRVLKVIDEQGLMKPLQVVQTLSTNAVATVGMVKRYLGDTIEKERREIENNRRMIETYKTETEKKKAEIEDLGSKPSVFQSQRCLACSLQLELPTVHFLCKHSFHQRCLNNVDDNPECPTCSASNQTIRTLRKAQDEYADRHEYFNSQLQESRDKLGTVSEFFGKGVMAAPPVFN
ncbi:hypothetical protein B9Z19DRAFT_1082628 [Tuber borchii]|uniref:E3 ubiquitin-protein ligase PEP5 n=1 Tax=Tuber borchii TaxID=42251 RepID=A0A2T6ZUA4_TUBBO|nr:hypothetical protein B9Z19DRAFT_1082628 [Tuber borchii]